MVPPHFIWEDVRHKFSIYTGFHHIIQEHFMNITQLEVFHSVLVPTLIVSVYTCRACGTFVLVYCMQFDDLRLIDQLTCHVSTEHQPIVDFRLANHFLISQ